MYTKLFTSILTSTIWLESGPTRLLWITLLAMADKHGEIMGSIPGMAKQAGIEIAECRQGFAVLMRPDPDSRSKDCEGRRLIEIDGGWRLVNHGKYRALASTHDAMAKNAARQREFKARQRAKVTEVTLGNDGNAPVTLGNAPVTQGNAGVTPNTRKAEAEAEAENTTIHAERPASPGASERILFEKLADLEGSVGQLTQPAKDKIRHALRAILAVCPGLTPWELDDRAARYWEVMPKGVKLTAHALAANWAKCAPVAASVVQIEDGPEGWRLFLEKAYPDNLTNAEQRPWSDLPKVKQKEVAALAKAAELKLRKA